MHRSDSNPETAPTQVMETYVPDGEDEEREFKEAKKLPEVSGRKSSSPPLSNHPNGLLAHKNSQPANFSCSGLRSSPK